MPDLILTRRHALAALGGLACATLGASAALSQARPVQWAVPVDLAGVPNLFRVTPNIYRSAQPDARGFAALAEYGIKTVINLRRRVDDAPLAAGTGLATLHIKIKTRNVTEHHADAIVLALRSLDRAQSQGPVLVHCTHGADRTGMIVALWRMLNQGWSREAAISELRNGGFGFHQVWVNIPHYLETADLAELRARIAA